MPFYTDQLNRVTEISHSPKRIVSLVPSQTELLSALGLDEEVIGITKFCIHPEHWFRNKTRVGGTKTVDIKKLAALHPDLVIANKEENTKEQIGLLEKIAPVWISDINTIPDALQMISEIGIITGKEKTARSIIRQIENDFWDFQSQLHKYTPKKYRTAYLIWKNPYMAAGAGTFINDMMNLNGMENVFAAGERYPATDCNELKEKNTELILLSSEPYPFKQDHINELRNTLRGTKVIAVDGEIFSWYGSRMLRATAYFQQLQVAIHQNNV